MAVPSNLYGSKLSKCFQSTQKPEDAALRNFLLIPREINDSNYFLGYFLGALMRNEQPNSQLRNSGAEEYNE